MDGHLGMAEIAKLLGVSRPRVWQLRKRPDFPAPAGNDGGRDYWYDTTILRWAAGAGRELARRAPLLYRPVSGVHPARYLGAWEVGGYVVVTFDAELGRVCLGYPRIDQYTQPVTGLVAAVDAEVVVRVESHWDARGPELTAVDRDEPSRSYPPDWEDLARVLGMPVPWWPAALRRPEAMLRWRPGDRPALVEAISEPDPTPLLRLAAAEADESCVHRAALHMARQLQATGLKDAVDDLEMLDRDAAAATRDAITVAATPVLGSWQADEEPSEAVRRDAWARITARTDGLAAECVGLGLAWNGGVDFPFGATTRVDPRRGGPGAEWASTLQPAELTAALARFAEPRHGGALHDPATDLPAVIDHEGVIRAAVPQRLPALAPLAEVILHDHNVWIRTSDKTLYLAPELPGKGLSWGYNGSGPLTLALLLARLLDDINAGPPPDYDDPDTIPALVAAAKTWRDGTVLTRTDLELLRAGTNR